MTDRDPFPGSQRLTAADPAFYASIEAIDKTIESPYELFALSPAIHWDAEGRMFIDGVPVRERWWRRVSNWAWRWRLRRKMYPDKPGKWLW